MADVNNNDDDISERLILLVSDHPVLFDKSDPNYKDVNMRDNVWQFIADQMNSTSDAVTKRWKAIRDSYSRKNREQATKSGQGAKKITPYKFSQQLSFLDCHIKSKSNNISNFESEVECVSSGEETTLTEAKKIPGKRCKTEKADKLSEGILEYLKERSNSTRKNERDADELWLLSLAPNMRRLNDYQKGLARMKIQQLLLEIEFGSGPQNQQYPASYQYSQPLNDPYGVNQSYQQQNFDSHTYSSL